MALKYIAKYWVGLNLFMTDGRIEIDNKTVERCMRPIALNRKNALFAGHDAGAQNWAMLASIIETCKLNKIEPHAYLTGVLTATSRRILKCYCRGILTSKTTLTNDSNEPKMQYAATTIYDCFFGIGPTSRLSDT